MAVEVIGVDGAVEVEEAVAVEECVHCHTYSVKSGLSIALYTVPRLM